MHQPIKQYKVGSFEQLHGSNTEVELSTYFWEVQYFSMLIVLCSPIRPKSEYIVCFWASIYWTHIGLANTWFCSLGFEYCTREYMVVLSALKFKRKT